MLQLNEVIRFEFVPLYYMFLAYVARGVFSFRIYVYSIYVFMNIQVFYNNMCVGNMRLKLGKFKNNLRNKCRLNFFIRKPSFCLSLNFLNFS